MLVSFILISRFYVVILNSARIEDLANAFLMDMGIYMSKECVEKPQWLPYIRCDPFHIKVGLYVSV